MPDFPGVGFWPVKDAIGCGTEVLCVGERIVAANAANASVTFPAANRAIFVPFVVGSRFTAMKMVVENTATVSGNIDAGIYDQSGNKIVTMGSTLMAGANGAQVLDIADTTIPPGRYYMAFACSSATATFSGWAPAVGLCSSMGVLQMATAFALPATATYAACTSAVIPDFYVVGRTLT